jgi:hypothetical protein
VQEPIESCSPLIGRGSRIVTGLLAKDNLKWYGRRSDINEQLADIASELGVILSVKLGYGDAIREGKAGRPRRSRRTQACL